MQGERTAVLLERARQQHDGSGLVGKRKEKEKAGAIARTSLGAEILSGTAVVLA
jgi:hypothetical protein